MDKDIPSNALNHDEIMSLGLMFEVNGFCSYLRTLPMALESMKSV